MSKIWSVVLVTVSFALMTCAYADDIGNTHTQGLIRMKLWYEGIDLSSHEQNDYNKALVKGMNNKIEYIEELEVALEKYDS